MAEYRVTVLHYRFEGERDNDRFDKAEPQYGSLSDDFDYTLEDGVLRAVPRVEFREEMAARDALEAHLRNWEQASFLNSPSHRIRFDFDGSDLEEVHPRPDTTTMFVPTIAMHARAFPPTVVVDTPTYPEPDPSFKRTPVTDRLSERLRRVRDGEAELPATAYMVLTTIEQEFGGSSDQRRNAARTLGIDFAVLDRLGNLSGRADPDLGRKGKGDPTPLTPAELKWMDAVVVRLIRRVGEHGAGGTLTTVAMSDFPALP